MQRWSGPKSLATANGGTSETLEKSKQSKGCTDVRWKQRQYNLNASPGRTDQPTIGSPWGGL